MRGTHGCTSSLPSVAKPADSSNQAQTRCGASGMACTVCLLSEWSIGGAATLRHGASRRARAPPPLLHLPRQRKTLPSSSLADSSASGTRCGKPHQKSSRRRLGKLGSAYPSVSPVRVGEMWWAPWVLRSYRWLSLGGPLWVPTFSRARTAPSGVTRAKGEAALELWKRN